MDELARDYLLVALSVGELQEGIVDAYYGPPELRQQAAAAQLDAAALAGQAAALRARLGDATDDAQRGSGSMPAQGWRRGRRLSGELLHRRGRALLRRRARADRPRTTHRVRTDLDDLLPAAATCAALERDRRLTGAGRSVGERRRLGCDSCVPRRPAAGRCPTASASRSAWSRPTVGGLQLVRRHRVAHRGQYRSADARHQLATILARDVPRHHMEHA
jgi:hypothetical protein